MADQQGSKTFIDVLIAVIGAAAPIIGATAYIIKRRATNGKLPKDDPDADPELDADSEDSEKKQPSSEVYLTDHPFFTRIQALKQHLNYSFTLPNKGKEEVFRDILIAKMDIWSNLLMELCDNVDEGKIEDSTELYNEHMKLFQAAIEQYASYYVTQRYTAEEQRVLSIVMEKFNKWHYKRIENTPQMLVSICNSVFYTDVKTKAAVILDTYLSEFINTIQDAQMTLNELNGDLKGLVFKGYTI